MATFRVTVPMTQEELERRLIHILWDGARSLAINRAKRELAKRHSAEYSELVYNYLDGYNPEVEVTKIS